MATGGVKIIWPSLWSARKRALREEPGNYWPLLCGLRSGSQLTWRHVNKFRLAGDNLFARRYSGRLIPADHLLFIYLSIYLARTPQTTVTARERR